MTHKMAVIVLLICFYLMAGATEVEIIPYASPPLLNGIEGEQEWHYPEVIVWGWYTVSLRLKQDSHYVYLSVTDHDTSHSGLDLYLDNMAGDIMMLHVSSAHGQRRMDDTGWGEMTYGPPEFWSSNIIENIFEEGRMKFLSPEIFEFQIDKCLLPSRTFKLMVHLKRPDTWIPPESDTLSSDEWIEMELYR